MVFARAPHHVRPRSSSQKFCFLPMNLPPRSGRTACSMKPAVLLLLAAWLAPFLARGQSTARVDVVFSDRLGPLRIDGMALGQGGLSAEPMWDNRVSEISALQPSVIRLF